MLSLIAERYDTDPANVVLAWGGVLDIGVIKPNATKVLGSIVQAKALRKMFPQMQLHVRHIGLLEDAWQGRKPSTALAKEYYAANEHVFAQMPSAFWNVYPNEPSVDVSELPGLNDYYATLGELMGKGGYGLDGFMLSAEARFADFAPGTSKRKFEYCYDALKALRQWGHFLDMHSYFSPNMFDAGYEPFLFPDRELKTELMKLRPSDWQLYYPRQTKGEVGIDSILSLAKRYDGYRTCRTNAEYTDQLVQYNAELIKDGVDGFVYIATRTDKETDMMYNVLIGAPATKQHEADPSVADRLLPVLGANVAYTARPTVYGNTTPVPVPVPGPTQPPQGSGPKLAHATSRLNIRSGPGTNYTVLRVADAGEPIYITSANIGGFYKLDSTLDIAHGSPKPCEAYASGAYLS